MGTLTPFDNSDLILAFIRNVWLKTIIMVLLVEETGVLGENHRPATNFYHIMLYWVHLAWSRFELTTLVVIGTDCIGSCKSNYHMIMTTKAPDWKWAVQQFFDKILELTVLFLIFLSIQSLHGSLANCFNIWGVGDPWNKGSWNVEV